MVTHIRRSWHTHLMSCICALALALAVILVLPFVLVIYVFSFTTTRAPLMPTMGDTCRYGRINRGGESDGAAEGFKVLR